ncbi:hypothetical protein [uncultured Algibacter sp.]|uniref:hypothetical protein n=1 Tax=uncultured Algibacter sp. TaxID=298659 RepID=UPI0032177BC3
MSKNKILLLSAVLGCFYVFQKPISSEVTQEPNISNDVLQNRTYSSLVTSTISGTNVYICKGPGSKRYHYKKNCRGLKSCSTKIHEVSLSKAKELKRTLCGWED